VYGQAGIFLRSQGSRQKIEKDATWIAEKLSNWVFHLDKFPIAIDNLDLPPDDMWTVISADEEWRPFAQMAVRIVTLVISEAEMERTISLQRDILGNKANQTSEKMLTARTQLRQRYSGYE
jgi:hypothetical protein